MDSEELMAAQESCTDKKNYLEGSYGDMKIRIKVEQDPLDSCDVDAMLDGKFLEPKMNLRKLIRLTARRKDFLCYLIWKGLLVRDPPCHVCGLPMIMTFRNSRCYQEYRCHKEGPAQHKVAVNALKDSWFSCCKLPMDKVMLITYMFALGYTSFETLVRETSSEECTTSRSTVADWMGYCREVTLDWCERNQARGRIGGKGVVVEVEGVKLGKRKARPLDNPSWVMGLTEIKVGNCGAFRVEVTDKRDPGSLLPVFEKLVEVGTTIVCDNWRTVYRLTKTGFKKVSVVGGKVVVQAPGVASARPGDHEWRAMKAKVIGFPRKKMETLVHEHLWRRHVKANCLDPFEHFVGCIKELYRLGGE
ncbi:hypothetical protein J437_LFUL018023 [Ladona fulva]|uniref:ISXO2-like transposase domain-containing protein n=1 Tax=Ladona fulva TaxID=123851 RepID=A0A8K0KPT6_LADFU|nr:hypothetical protein J437_LFUL018023 [Ladona fulva]